MSNTIFYICDGRACNKPCDPCRHTSDIRHAKNFYYHGGAYFEKDPEQIVEPRELPAPKWFFENTKQFKRRACICGTKTAPVLEIVPTGPVQYYLRCPSCGRIGKTSTTTRGALINWNMRQLED